MKKLFFLFSLLGIPMFFILIICYFDILCQNYDPLRLSKCYQQDQKKYMELVLIFSYNKMLPIRLHIKSPHKPATAPPTLTSLPKADIFISLQNLLIPCHRKKVSQIKQISQTPTSKRIMLIHKPLNNTLTQQIVNYYYGIDIEIRQIQKLSQMLQILLYLQIESIKNKIQEYLIINIKQFDTFTLLGITCKYQLKQVVGLCFEYLQLEEYEQFKYYQYSLLNCQFRLFQVLIRRHHRLKADRKAWGNSLECIEEIIKTYCRRNRYQKQIEDQLLSNYVTSCKISSHENTLKIKNSLRLNKLSFKNIGHSITLYGKDSQKIQKQSDFSLNTGNSSNTVNIRIIEPKSSDYIRPQSPVRVRKYSMQIDKIIGEMGLNRNLSKKNIQSSMQMQIQSTIPEEDQCLFDEIILSSQNMQKITKKDQEKQLRRIKTMQNDKIDLSQESISEIGNQGSLEINLHEIHQIERHALRPNTKSMIFPEVIEEEIEESMQHKMKKTIKKPCNQRISFIV